MGSWRPTCPAVSGSRGERRLRTSPVGGRPRRLLGHRDGNRRVAGRRPVPVRRPRRARRTPASGRPPAAAGVGRPRGDGPVRRGARPRAPTKTVVQCFEAAGEAVDLVIVAVGELGHQEVDETDPTRIVRMLTVNLTWPAAAMSAAAAQLQEAGARPHRGPVLRRRLPGPAVQLRLRVGQGRPRRLRTGPRRSRCGERASSVHIVRPGFVRTKMTTGRPAVPFAVGPDRVAADIVRGLRGGKAVIWSPGILRWVFGILRLVPQAVWRRMPG